MAEPELHLEDLTVPEVIAAATRLADGLEGNENFPDPKPTVAVLKGALEAVVEAQENYRRQRLLLNELKAARGVLVSALKEALASEVEYVREASDGSAEKIMSANLHVEQTWHLWPFGSLGQVQELAASLGDKPGEIDLVWDKIRGASGYEVEISRDVGPYGPWEPSAACGESGTTLEYLDRHQRYWFRVRAVGEHGVGDWSDPVTKFSR